MKTPMVEAKSMYLAGEKIAATDPRLTSSSYKDLGLRCTICGEPVQHRNGDINQPHFAHFPTIDPAKSEDCARRHSIPSNGSSIRKMNKGQRLSLFQQHFLSIIQKTVPGLKVGPGTVLFEADSIYQEIQESAFFELKNRQEYFFQYIRTSDHQMSSIDREIACEALEYLTVTSSKNIFMQISRHLISVETAFDLSIENTSYYNRLCLQIINMLATINWPDQFENASRHEGTKHNGHNEKPELYSIVKYRTDIKGSNNSLIYIQSGNLFLGTSKNDKIKPVTLLGRFDLKKMLKSQEVLSRKLLPRSKRKRTRRMPNVFRPSAEYQMVIQDNPAVREAVLDLIRKIDKKLFG